MGSLFIHGYGLRKEFVSGTAPEQNIPGCPVHSARQPKANLDVYLLANFSESLLRSSGRVFGSIRNLLAEVDGGVSDFVAGAAGLADNGVELVVRIGGESDGGNYAGSKAQQEWQKAEAAFFFHGVVLDFVLVL